MKRTKKGAAHVEMMLSFIIFISFVTFMLIIFKPLRIVAADTSALDITESKIIDYVSTNLTVSSLTLNSNFSADAGNCIYANFSLPSNITIKTENMSIIDAKRANEHIYFNYSGQRFYRVYSSEELEEKNFEITSCYELNESNYTIGVTRMQKKIAYSNLAKLNESYNNDYENLKKNLSLINDFTFVVRQGSEVIFRGERYKPKGIDIIAKDIPIEILDKNANLNPAVLNIQVWG